MKRWLLVLVASLIAALPPGAAAGEVTVNARRLAATLDAMNVERLWPAGQHVNWETGVPDGKPERGDGKHTHCSAFVASVAKRFDVYIVRPPEHGQVLLANAQYDWLAEQGAANGWKALAAGDDAQAYANRGYLVLAAYRNRHDDKPGHIAIVRPADKSPRAIADEGPEIAQAGATNYASTSLKRGFAGHPAAWTRNEVRYYAHAIDWHRLARSPDER